MSEWGKTTSPDFPEIGMWRLGNWLLLRRNGHTRWLFGGVIRNEWTFERFHRFMADSKEQAEGA